MKVLDRYILRELFLPIFYCSLTLVFLILIADLFDNLDELLRHETPFPIFARYYLSLIPYAFTQTIPWATWLGTLFLLVNFGFHNELVAMKVAGLKIITIIRPILFLGFLIGLGTFIISDRVVPPTFRSANELREVYIEKKKEIREEKSIQNVTYRSTDNHIYYMRSLLPEEMKAEDIVILWLDRKDRKTRQKIAAERGQWHGTTWKFFDVTEHKLDSRGRIFGEPRTYPEKTYPELTVSPFDLASTSQDSIYLTYKEMKRSMEKLKETGVNVYSEEVDLHYRLASPWQSFVMMLIAIPLLARTKTRKGIATSMLICIGLVFAYHVFGAIAIALGKSGKLFPFFSAWAGNIFFTVGSLVTLERANF